MQQVLCVNESSRRREKKRVRDPGRIKRVFSAHCDGSTQNPFPQEKLAPGEAL